MVRIRMSRDDKLNLPIPERDMTPDTCEELSPRTSTIDEYLVTAVDDEDSIALTHIEEHYLGLLREE
jgi:hypothetical protein